MPNRQPILLNPRDSVFLLHDIPHFLSPSNTVEPETALSAMRPLQQNLDGSTGLVCGFFNFHGAVSKLMLDSFPSFLVVRAEDMRLRAASALFDLLLDEPALDADKPSPLTGRLTELLFFYVIRLVAKDQDIGSGLLAVAQRPEFSKLVENVMTDPGRDWTVDNMARTSHMSRASFYRNFTDICGQPPARFLVSLRMKIAAQRLDAGESIGQTAEHVGYKSYAAFSRAFKKEIGEQPGAYRRSGKIGQSIHGA